jgi:hypothetical protein
MRPTPTIRAKILRAIKRGTLPIDIAQKFNLSLGAIAEIADPKGMAVPPKKTLPPLR